MASKITRHGKTYWVGAVSRKNPPWRKQKNFPTRKEAATWERQVNGWLDEGRPYAEVEALIDGRPLIETRSDSLLDWATAYLKFSTVKHAGCTFEEKEVLFKRFFKEVDPNMPVGHLTPRIVLNYLQLQVSARSGNSANKDRKNLIAAWNWGIKYHALPSPNPCLVDRFAEKHEEVYVPSEDDFWKVYAACAVDSDRTLLMFLLHTGARRGEAFSRKWSDIDWNNSLIRLSTRKRQDGSMEDDWVPMTEELREHLLLHKELSAHAFNQFQQGVKVDYPPSVTYLFTAMDGRPFMYRTKFMDEVCAKAKVKSFGYHAIRHLTASILDKAGVELSVIQAILRHQSATTTARYLHKLRGPKVVLDGLLPTAPKKPGKLLKLREENQAG